MLDTIRVNYNAFFRGRNPRVEFNSDKWEVTIPCKIVDFMDETYGKYPSSDADSQILMEYNELFPYLLDYLPSGIVSDPNFVAYMEQDRFFEQYAAMMMYTLPSPRYKYYTSSDFAVIRQKVLSETNEIIEKTGFYPITSDSSLLLLMQVFSFAILFLGLIFDILLILFVIISILLIYSLLMITTETKTFDTGIMRLLGLSSYGFVAMIMTQAIMFVIPSIICAYITSYPVLWIIFKKIF